MLTSEICRPDTAKAQIRNWFEKLTTASHLGASRFRENRQQDGPGHRLRWRPSPLTAPLRRAAPLSSHRQGDVQSKTRHRRSAEKTFFAGLYEYSDTRFPAENNMRIVWSILNTFRNQIKPRSICLFFCLVSSFLSLTSPANIRKSCWFQTSQ